MYSREYNGGGMVSFASLFVGFVIGIVNIQLTASGGVDRVELFLDSQPVAELREPFSTPLDLGCEPSPHELVAVAYDSQGTEVARARQWINRPRAASEASLVLEAGRGGSGRVARLTWRALVGEVPTSVTATFDGAQIPVTDSSRIELPAYEPAQIHYAGAVVDFGKGISASADLIFGGSRTVETHTELTAVAVELGKKASLPPVGDLAGWFEKNGVPLRVAAVESGGVDIIFVAEGTARAALKKAFRRGVSYDAEPPSSRLPAGKAFRGAETIENLPTVETLREEDLRFRFVWPIGRSTAQTEMVANVYQSTPWLSQKNSSIARFAGWSLYWPPWTRDGQRLADAVAVAGLAAAEANRKRVVVLLLGPEAKDGSLLTPDEAMSFLRRLGVPLQVWSIGRRSPEALRWKDETRVSAYHGQYFDDAVRQLVKQVDRQRIIWIEGAHLPQEVALSSLARGLRLAQ